MNKLLFHNTPGYRLSRHLILVSATILFFAMLLRNGGNYKNYFEALQVTASNAVFFLGYAYLTLFLLIPRFLLKGKIKSFSAIFILLGISLSAAKLLVSDEIFYASVSPEYFFSGNQGVWNKLFMNAKDMTFLVALFCVGKFTKDYSYTMRQIENLEVQNREARNRLLQSQLNPHFLYNTINNLYALSLLEPGKTLKVTRMIKKVLQYIVEQGRLDFVPLAREVELVKSYISLEKLRYGNRLKVKILKKGKVSGWQIPPMILFFMAENSIRHGSRSDAGTPWINMTVDARQELLLLEANNSKPGTVLFKEQGKPGGEGLQNLKKRLRILYPASGYNLAIDENDHCYCIRLTLFKIKNDLGRHTYR